MSFSRRIRQRFCASTIRFDVLQSTNNLINSHMRKRFSEWVHRQVVCIYCACQHWNFTGYKRIKQRRISFVLGYLRMILWKNSTGISIKHRILATFNKKRKKSILTACMPLIVSIIIFYFLYPHIFSLYANKYCLGIKYISIWNPQIMF